MGLLAMQPNKLGSKSIEMTQVQEEKNKKSIIP